jgi:mono/diheme cytochrome c family protein
LGVFMLRLAVAFAGSLIATGALGQESLLERGRYLVDAVMACDGCHTPRPGGNFDMSRRFSGGSQIWDEPAYLVRGSNISSDRETGIGSWSLDEIKRLLTQAVRPNGIPVVAQMPYPFYKVLTARDLDAVATYVKSVKPVRNEVPPPVYRGPSQSYDIPGGEKPFTEEMLNDPLKRGYYLANLAHCMECHARRPDGKQDYVNWWGRGGAIFKGPKGEVKATNITSHAATGIGAWSDAEIRRVLTHGVGRDGRPLAQQMQRQIYFAKMTDADLDAIVAWVRTIPPLE